MDPYILVFSHKHPSCSGQSLFSIQLASIRYITPYVSLFWRSVSPSLQQASAGSHRGLIRPTLLFIARTAIIIFLPSDQLHRFNYGHSRGRFTFQLGGGTGTHKKTQEENGIRDGRQRRERGLCNASTERGDKEKQSGYKRAEHSRRKRDKTRRRAASAPQDKPTESGCAVWRPAARPWHPPSPPTKTWAATRKPAQDHRHPRAIQ